MLISIQNKEKTLGAFGYSSTRFNCWFYHELCEEPGGPAQQMVLHGGLFVPGYGYGRFLKMITTNLPDWTDKSMNLYIESRYGVNTCRRYDKEKEKKMRSCNRKYTESTMKTAAHHLHELQDLK